MIASTAALSGCSSGGTPAHANETKSDLINAVPVEVASAIRSPISASYDATSTLVPEHEAEVSAKTTGVVIKLLVEEGMRVQEGQLLAVLDDATAQASASQAEAQMHKADATFAYADQSIKKQLISKREFDQAMFDMQAQRAAYQTTKLQVAFTRIVAPISGVISERSIKVGNLVQINQNLFHIVDMDSLQAVLNVPERQLGILKSGQTVSMEADALAGRTFSGSILRVAPVVDPTSGTFRVTCEFRDKTQSLKPGMFGRIEIVYDHREDALTIPRSALMQEDGENAVFVVEKAVIATASATATKSIVGSTQAKITESHAGEGYVAHRRLVKIGYSEGEKVEIQSGIEKGTQVITVGRNAVRDGTAVQLLPGPVAGGKA